MANFKNHPTFPVIIQDCYMQNILWRVYGHSIFLGRNTKQNTTHQVPELDNTA